MASVNEINCDKCGVVVNQDNFYRDQWNNKNYDRCYDCGNSIRQEEELKELKEELETRKAMEKFFREKGIIGQNEYFDSKTREWKI